MKSPYIHMQQAVHVPSGVCWGPPLPRVVGYLFRTSFEKPNGATVHTAEKGKFK